MSYLFIVVVTFLLTACATKEGARAPTSGITPFRDFNLGSSEIPPLLTDARKHPYVMPADSSCKGLNADIKSLDELLGPDIDVPVAEADTADMVGETVTSAFQGVIDGVVPFRKWIRKLSGADQHARDVTAAASAGSARRAFLKGIKMINACPDPGGLDGAQRIAGTPP